MNEILDILEVSDGGEDIYILPPDANELTDEDSADSENEETYTPQRLPANLLWAPAELRDNRGDTFEEHENSDENMPLSNLIKTNPVKYSFTWENNFANTDMVPIFPETNFSKYKNFSPREFFELFIDNEIIESIIFQSHLYGNTKNFSCGLITKEELKTFIAILIVSSYDSKSSKRDYWNQGDDLRNEAIYRSMRRNKFEKNYANTSSK